MAAYKLRCSLFGHELDVRSLCNSYYPTGGIISCSRDVTSRLWVPNEGGLEYSDNHCMRGHRNFVVSVCMMPPDDKYPHGLIMTGSNDKNINAYTLDSTEPVFKLEGHANTVCALSAGKFGSLLSGSWDNTAKVWLNQKCVMTLKGHEAAVWAVAIMPEGGYMLTGSADKTIRMWRAGKSERTFGGHEDCVRGLAVLSGSEFLSCSNDMTIRRWLTSGDCTHTYYGHTNFVYSISVLPNGEDFVSGGEDRTLRVWKQGECVQTIEHPSESVWSVLALPNGDVATGGSDASIRVFSEAPERQAEEATQKEFEEQVVAAAIGVQGDGDIQSLPGPEVLQTPGTVHNQIVRIRDEANRVSAYKWISPEQRWEKQDVIGGPAMPKKTAFEGKEYDYVFTVEIQEGAPPLKLPFNIGDDPWMAAHTFLEKNEISPLFLDQVANFIISQAGGAAANTAPNSNYADPFTGGGRYIPGAGSAPAAPAAPAPAFGADPFTGGGSYKPGGSQAPAPAGHAPSFGADPFTGGGSYKPPGSEPSPAPNSYFPHTSYLFFEQANTQAILGKLREFNGKVGGEHQVSDSDIGSLQPLMDNTAATAPQFELIWKLLQWPTDVVFPALDVFRLCLRGAEANQHFFNVQDVETTVSHLLRMVSAGQSAPIHMLVARGFCNALKHSSGEQAVLARRDTIIGLLLDNFIAGNKNVEISFSTLLLNMAVAAHKNNDVEAKSQLLSAIATIMPQQKDTEAAFRLLVSCGTLVAGDENGIALAQSLDIPNEVEKFTRLIPPSKLPECAKLLLAALQ